MLHDEAADAAAAAPAPLSQALRAFEAHADEMSRRANFVLRVADPATVNAREREFASTLLRHAKGAKVAAAALRQELSLKR